MGKSKVTWIKSNSWLLSPNMFSNLPHLNMLQLYSTNYLCQKPWSHSHLLFSLILHLGPRHNPVPLDYWLLASTLVPLWSMLHTVDEAILWNHTSDRSYITKGAPCFSAPNNQLQYSVSDFPFIWPTEDCFLWANNRVSQTENRGLVQLFCRPLIFHPGYYPTASSFF